MQNPLVMYLVYIQVDLTTPGKCYHPEMRKKI